MTEKLQPVTEASLRSEAEIMSRWESGGEPLVSVSCMTYNHERFIRDAIHGFLIQETTFPFEIIIHDDASTDNTAAIVRTYAERYPGIIRPIYQKENQYSRGNRPSQFAKAARRGKYIAACEGDDYWQDPQKLEIQVLFLESHPEYVISGHNAVVVDENNCLLVDSFVAKASQRDWTAEELIRGESFIPTLSRVYRDIIAQQIPEGFLVHGGDAFLASVLGQYGKAKFHNEIKPGVYRRHPGGIWSSLSEEKKKDRLLSKWVGLHRYYDRIGKPEYADHFWAKAKEALLRNVESSELRTELARRRHRRVKSLLKKMLCGLASRSKRC